MLSKLTSESEFEELHRFVQISLVSLVSLSVLSMRSLALSSSLANIAGSCLHAEAYL